MRRFGSSAGRDTKEIRLLQVSQLFASDEVIEKIAAPGAGAESPYFRPHFRDPTGAREKRFVHWKTERKMGRFHNGSDQKIPGSAWVESDGEARCENPSAIGSWLRDIRRGRPAAARQFFLNEDFPRTIRPASVSPCSSVVDPFRITRPIIFGSSATGRKAGRPRRHNDVPWRN